MKGLMKVNSGDSAMWRGWRMIRYLRVYVGECASSHSVDRLWNRWIDIMKECLKKRGLDIRQARKMVQDRSEWQEFVKGNACGVARKVNPLTLTRCHSCWLPQLYEALEGWKFFCD